MKTPLFAILALLTATSAFATPRIDQSGPGCPPVAQGPADYRARDAGYDYDRGPDRDPRRQGRPDDRYNPRGDRYEQAPRYGYNGPQYPAPVPQPQPRRPLAVAIQIHL